MRTFVLYLKGVCTLGFTLAKLVKNVCMMNSASTMERKRNCINKLQQVLDTDKSYVRNITMNLNERINIKMNNQLNGTSEEDKLHFDKNLQLTSIHYTVSKLNNSQLVKIATYSECCGLRAVNTNQDNFDYLNSSMQPIYFNNAHTVVSSSNHYQINRPTQSTPSFGTRLSTRKTTIFINPTRQTSTTVVESTNSTESSLLFDSPTTDLTRIRNELTLTSDADSKTESFFTESNSRATNSIPFEVSNTASTIAKNTNRVETSTIGTFGSTIGTTLSTIEVVRIAADEPETNDISLGKIDRQTLNNRTKISSESLSNRRNNHNNNIIHINQSDHFVPSNQTRYIRKPIKKNENAQNNLPYISTSVSTSTSSFTSSRRKPSTSNRPSLKEQIPIKNGKIALNSTLSTVNTNLLDAKATVESAVASDRHSLSNHFKKDNETEIERRFSVVILFLSIGKWFLKEVKY